MRIPHPEGVKNMKLNLGRYGKAITAVVGQIMTYLSLYEGTNHWVVLVIAAASALGVYAVPNTPKTAGPVTPPVA